MTRTQIATADFSCGGMQKGTNGDESDKRLRTENSYINNRHKHTIIAILSVKKGSKFTDPDAQFPRGGALALQLVHLCLSVRHFFDFFT